MRLLITRPLADAEPLAQQLQGLGHQTVIEPLLDIRYLDTAAADTERLLDGAQALLVTSANGLRAFVAASPLRDVAVYAVGEASALAATQAGFSKVDSATGDVEALARRVIEQLQPQDGALLHVAGSRVAGDLAGSLGRAGFDVRRAVLYDAIKARQLSSPVNHDIATGSFDGVLLFSPRTAESFVALIEQAGLSETCEGMTAYCLSDAVAEKARVLNWCQVRVAARPDQQSLIETVKT